MVQMNNEPLKWLYHTGMTCFDMFGNAVCGSRNPVPLVKHSGIQYMPISA